MNYNVGERVKPKRHWPVKPLLFTVVIIAVLVLAVLYATGSIHLHHSATPASDTRPPQ